MNSDKYSRNIELICSTCGGTQFEYGDDIENDYVEVRCIGCDRVMSKEGLIDENSESIDEHTREVGKETVDDLAKRMKKEFKKAFRGNKNIKIK
nr:hypothetical protein [uncultured Halomonas sp.]